tara:strand:- start:485 stop:925 length:441 start_codon:yes stop_codon:yes gene_type:complete
MSKNPHLAVDIIIEVDNKIVLIERKKSPHGWAITGGFVNYGESVEHAAIREAKEETGLEVTLTDLLYVYSEPSRDPRKHVVSVAFIAKAEGVPVGADDAKKAGLFELSKLPTPLCFDHARILEHYQVFKTHGVLIPTTELKHFSIQ